MILTDAPARFCRYCGSPMACHAVSQAIPRPRRNGKYNSLTGQLSRYDILTTDNPRGYVTPSAIQGVYVCLASAWRKFRDHPIGLSGDKQVLLSGGQTVELDGDYTPSFIFTQETK